MPLTNLNNDHFNLAEMQQARDAWEIILKGRTELSKGRRPLISINNQLNM